MARSANYCFISMFVNALLFFLLGDTFGDRFFNSELLLGMLLLAAASLLASVLFSFFQLIAACFRPNRSLLLSGIGKAFFSTILLLGFLLPAFSFSRGPVYDRQHSNNLRQLQFALLYYAEAHDGQLPPHRTGNGPDENGIYPHSWRVHILPYMEQKDLYEKIRLTEPWDSAWNRQFHDQMPSPFQSPFFRTNGMQHADGLETQPKLSETSYCVVTGPDELFPENGDSASVKDLQKNGSAPRILLSDSVPGCWMDPEHDISMEDVKKNGLDAPKGFRAYYRKRFIVVLETWENGILVLNREELEERLGLR